MPNCIEVIELLLRDSLQAISNLWFRKKLFQFYSRLKVPIFLLHRIFDVAGEHS